MRQYYPFCAVKVPCWGRLNVSGTVGTSPHIRNESGVFGTTSGIQRKSWQKCQGSSVELVRFLRKTDNWGDILRLVASLQAGTVLPSAMLKRLAAFQRQNQLDLALQELGRIERTLFMLDWLESPQLRQLCQAGLNKSEQRHVLAQVICTFKQGRIADRGQDAQQFRASGLNLAIAAIVHWNSTYLTDALDHMRANGRHVPPEWLAHTSPLTWEHIGCQFP